MSNSSMPEIINPKLLNFACVYPAPKDPNPWESMILQSGMFNQEHNQMAINPLYLLFPNNRQIPS